jgi:hypothetical protein
MTGGCRNMKFSLIQAVNSDLPMGSRKKTGPKLLALTLIVSFCLAALPGCNRKPQTANEESGNSFDHASRGVHLDPVQVTHGVAKMQTVLKFPFDVPAHVITPRLEGEFSSFVQGSGGERIADESADVELMVMTQDQYDAFEQKRSAESVYAIDPSHDHGVSISLPATQADPVRYYAVFRRSNDGKKPIWVRADLKAEFEAQ